MKNAQIRAEMRRRGVYSYEIAEKLGCCKGTLFNHLAKDLPPEEERRIYRAIDELAEERFQQRYK